MSNPKIQALVANFAATLERLVHEQALETVSQALGPFAGSASKKAPTAKTKFKSPSANRASSAKATPAKSKAAAKPKATSQGKRARRTTADIERDAGRILGYVKSHPAQRAEAIKKSLGIASNHWALPIALLVSRGAITSKGAKRATSYSAR